MSESGRQCLTGGDRNQFSLAVALFFSLISFNVLFLPAAQAAVGDITTVAGNGSRGFSGDGGAAAVASLYFPHGVTVVSSGNLYIADEGNERIRVVQLSAVVTNNPPTPANDSFAASHGERSEGD